MPLIIKLPGVVAANETRGFATTLDISATIVAASGAEIPKGYQGFDLLGPLSRAEPSPRKVAVATEYRANAVVTPSWKLSYFPEYNEGRLFDRIADPAEQEDLFNSTKHEAVKTGLLTALLRWRAQQDPIQWIQANSRPGAETATLAYEHTSSLRGTDAEIRLQEDALKFEPR